MSADCHTGLLHERSLQFIILALEPLGFFPPSMFIWVVSRNILIVALEKVSSIASKCAALPAFGPLSLATFCSGGRPHCRSVNGALCNRCLHIYFLLNKRGAFLLLRAFHWRKWLFFCFVFYYYCDLIMADNDCMHTDRLVPGCLHCHFCWWHTDC